jgi:hypothetical protein
LIPLRSNSSTAAAGEVLAGAFAVAVFFAGGVFALALAMVLS